MSDEELFNVSCTYLTNIPKAFLAKSKTEDQSTKLYTNSKTRGQVESKRAIILKRFRTDRDPDP